MVLVRIYLYEREHAHVFFLHGGSRNSDSGCWPIGLWGMPTGSHDSPHADLHSRPPHWDSQCMARAPQWLVRRFQVGSWLRVGLAGGALQVSVSAMELRNIYRVNLAPGQDSRRLIFAAGICENITSIIHPPAQTHMADVSAIRTNSSPLLHQYCTIIQESNT